MKLTIGSGTTVVAENADGSKVFKTLVKPMEADSADVVANEAGLFLFPLAVNSKGWLRVYVEPEHVATTAGPSCLRHGGELVNDECWECSAERGERLAEQAEDARVAAYKAQRDYRRESCGPSCRAGHNADEPCLGTQPTAPTATVKDGTYTVVFDEANYATIRFETSTNTHKQDGTPNSWYGKQFVQYLNGPENETDFQSFGTWERGDVRVWRKHQDSVAIARYVKAALVVAGSDDPGQFGQAYALRSGRCCNCGRKLTVPASLHRGMGPVCAEGGRDS